MKSLGPLLILLVSMISIQVGSSQAKKLFLLVGSEGTTFLRQAFATLILFVIFRPWKVKLTKKQLKPIILYGVVLGFMNLTFYYSIARIPLGIAVAIEFIGPLTLALLTSKKPLDFLWAFLAAFGIFLILPLSDLSAPIDLLGVALAFIAGVFWALYILTGQKAGTHSHAGVVTALGMLVACVVTSPVGIYEAGTKLLDFNILPLALTVAVLSGALPYSLEMVALKKIPTNTFGILMSLEPAIAALTGLIFLGEKLETIQWVAVFSIILASLGSSIFIKKISHQSQSDILPVP